MNFRVSTEGEALVLADEQYPANVRGIDSQLKNGTGVALAKGDLTVLDTSTVGTAGDYTQVILITDATSLVATGAGFHLVAQEAIAIGASGRFRLFGDTVVNLAANSGVNAKISPSTAGGGVVTAATTTGGAFIGRKVIGLTKVTGTGAKRCLFDGRPAGLSTQV